MFIESIKVKNFRSIYDETLKFDNLTALVGANGSGKSSFLHALKFFQLEKPKISAEDFHNKNTGKDIVFEITFNKLSNKEEKQFGNYVQNGELVVRRMFKFDKNTNECTYCGLKNQNPSFKEIRECIQATDKKNKYKNLREEENYSQLPEYTNQDQVNKEFDKWELDNPQKCKLDEDDGQYFSFNEKKRVNLGKHIKFLYIPAVRDASVDADEGKDSTLAVLMNTIIRKDLKLNEELEKFQSKIENEYKQIFNTNNSYGISELSNSLTDTLHNYVPDAKIKLSLNEKNFSVKLPPANANLIEDGYESSVDRTGHGLQRAFIMTLLQHLETLNQKEIDESTSDQNKIESTLNQKEIDESTSDQNKIESTLNQKEIDESTSDTPTLVLIIEEPELYQHPDRQRHLFKIYNNLSEKQKSKKISQTQIVYSTHSPYFIKFDKIEQIRILRKEKRNGKKTMVTKIFSTTLKPLAAELKKIYDKNRNIKNVRPQLQKAETLWINEGFFAKKVVLVEGETDRAAILGAAEVLEKKLEGNGISVISCNGKDKLIVPRIIFKAFKIPTYVIWDNDEKKSDSKEDGKKINEHNIDDDKKKCDCKKDAKKINKHNIEDDIKKNRKLLKLHDAKEEDFPSRIESNYACLDVDLETVLKNDIGSEKYKEILKKCADNYNLDKSQVFKNPIVVRAMMNELKINEIPLTLKNIINRIKEL